jgi:chemotaxis protein MotB
MKSKLFVKKLFVLIALAVLFVGCKPKETKTKGANKDKLHELIDTYSQANAILTDDIANKEKEIELLKADLMSLQQQGTVDNDTIARILELVKTSDGGVKITDEGYVLDSDITFASGSEVLSSKGLSNIKKLLDTGALTGNRVYIVGHTDTDPIVKTKAKHSSNFELSAKRAAHVAEHLISLGIPGEKIVVQAHGEFKPLSGKTKREQRRIVFKVVK